LHSAGHISHSTGHILHSTGRILHSSGHKLTALPYKFKQKPAREQGRKARRGEERHGEKEIIELLFKFSSSPLLAFLLFSSLLTE
jgi:hypothetical protein